MFLKLISLISGQVWVKSNCPRRKSAGFTRSVSKFLCRAMFQQQTWVVLSVQALGVDLIPSILSHGLSCLERNKNRNKADVMRRSHKTATFQRNQNKADEISCTRKYCDKAVKLGNCVLCSYIVVTHTSLFMSMTHFRQSVISLIHKKISWKTSLFVKCFENYWKQPSTHFSLWHSPLKMIKSLAKHWVSAFPRECFCRRQQQRIEASNHPFYHHTRLSPWGRERVDEPE